MRLSRIYQNSLFNIGETITLDERASHYLLHVLRIKLGYSLILFDGLGHSAEAIVQAFQKKTITVIIKKCFTEDVESPLKIHLYQGVCRGEKMDLVVQKAVELGVSAITPMMTERCQSSFDDKRRENRLEHWQQVIISACEQSGRSVLPVLNGFMNFSDYKNSQQAIVLHPEASNKLSACKISSPLLFPTGEEGQRGFCDLLIGPEGGFSEFEIEYLISKQVTPVSMGARVLRSETAGLAAIAVLQALAGDF